MHKYGLIAMSLILHACPLGLEAVTIASNTVGNNKGDVVCLGRRGARLCKMCAGDETGSQDLREAQVFVNMV